MIMFEFVLQPLGPLFVFVRITDKCVILLVHFTPFLLQQPVPDAGALGLDLAVEGVEVFDLSVLGR